MIIRQFSLKILVYCTLCLLAQLAVAVAPAQQSSPQNGKKLQDYLRRLGLDDLNIVVLQKQLEKQSDRGQQVELAKKLANYHTRQIQQNEFNASEQLDSRQQLAKLQLRFPELKHPKFAVAVLSVDFGHLQSKFFSWVTNQRTDDSLKKQLVKQFSSLDQQWQKAFSESKKRLDEQAAKKSKQPEFEPADPELVALVSQLEFVGGWLKYYLSILATEQRQERLKQSGENFLRLIGVESVTELVKLKSDELELEISWVSRSVLGLAMVTSAESNSQSSKLFQFLSDARVPSTIRADVDWWEFQSAALAKQWKKSTEILRQKLLIDQQQQQNARLWLSGLQCVKLADKPSEVQELVLYSLQGLARENQFQTTRKFCNENPKFADDSRFIFQWLNAQKEYEQGEKNTRQSHFASCKKLIESAIKSNEPTVKKTDLARCRYLLGWAEFRLGNYERASKLFRQASLGLRSRDPETAAKALWIRIVAIRNSDAGDSRKIVSALNEIRRLFPGSTYDEKAAFELSKLRTANRSVRETIQQLQKITPDNSAYSQAQLEIARLYFQSLKDPKLSDDERKKWINDFQDSVRILLKNEQVDDNTRSKSVALVVESLLVARPPDLSEAKQWLELANRALDKKYAQSADLTFQKFRVAKLSADTEESVRQANWLASSENTNRSYKTAALIFLARHYDEKLKQADFDQIKSLLSKAETTYQSLSELLGSDPQTLKSKSNARTAFARWADLQARNGKPENAIKIYEKLRQTLPNYQRYILRLAQLKTDSNQADEALDLWRKLAAGTKPGSEIWYEAKFNVIKTVSKTNLRSAKSILNQTVRLSPNMPESWKARYHKLSKGLNGQQLP